MQTSSGQNRAEVNVDQTLCKVARQRAADMANRGYFDHVNPDGHGPDYLVEQAGYPLPAWWGNDPTSNFIESICAGYTSADAAWAGWMGSPDHKTHLLAEDSFYVDQTSMGVGVVDKPGSQYETYYVIITCPPRPVPALAIASPNDHQDVDSDSVALSGSSASTTATAIQFRVENDEGNGAYVTATGTKNWSGVATGLLPGHNTVRVQALNGGSVETEATVRVDFVSLSNLLVDVSGNGTVTSGFDGSSSRAIGQSFTVKATPADGFIFTGWTGDVSADTRSLTFTMQANTHLVATFIPNPYAAISGFYNGTFDTGANAGLIKLTLETNGQFNGRLLLPGESFALHGKFAPDGTFQQNLTSRDGQKLQLALTANLGGNGQPITGTLQIAGVAVPVTIGLAATSTTAGRYTIVLPASDPATSTEPPGDAIATLAVDAQGVATISGYLADGTPFQSKSRLTAAGEIPLFVNLAHGKGWLGGTVLLSAAGNRDPAGSIRWVKTAQPRQALYPAGFDLTRPVLGSRYTAPTDGSCPLQLPAGSDSAVLNAGAGNLDTPLEETVAVDNGPDAASAPGSPAAAVRINSRNGMVKGSFLDPATNGLREFRGVVLQNQNTAFGYFRGDSESGYITLAPAAE